MLLVALVITASVPATNPIIIGMGKEACAFAMSASQRETSSAYVWGEWTGLNIAAGKPVGGSMETTSVLNEVAAYCAATPSISLADAVRNIHKKLAKRNR